MPSAIGATPASASAVFARSTAFPSTRVRMLFLFRPLPEQRPQTRRHSRSRSREPHPAAPRGAGTAAPVVASRQLTHAAPPFQPLGRWLIQAKNVVTDNPRGEAPAPLGLRLQARAEFAPLSVNDSAPGLSRQAQRGRRRSRSSSHGRGVRKRGQAPTRANVASHRCRRRNHRSHRDGLDPRLRNLEPRTRKEKRRTRLRVERLASGTTVTMRKKLATH